jgi:hypothetical protein
MARQEFGPFSFDPPPQWNSHTTVVYVHPSEEPATPPNIVVSHENRSGDDDVASHAWRKLIEAGRTLPGFELVSSRETKIAGQIAFKAVYRWKSERGPVEQAFAWVGGPERTLLTLAATTFGSRGAFDELDRILGSVRLGARDSVPPPAPKPPSSPDLNASAGMQGMFAAVPMPGARPARR